MTSEEANQKRLDPLIGVSLFTGAGGLDIGMERAGFVPRFVTDLEPSCVETLQANQARGIKVSGGSQHAFLKTADIRQADICALSGKSVRNRVRRRIDCVYGGPPCQSFSSCGKMGSIADPRGILVFEFCRFVEEARPRTFVMENVRGLVTARSDGGEPGGVLRQLVDRFEAAGYGVSVAVLNSADFGSFQRRVRCFVIGVDSGSPPEFPTPSHSKIPDRNLLFGNQVKSWRTLGEFLDCYSDDSTQNWIRPTPKLASALESIPEGSGLKSAGVVETTRPGGHWGYRQGTFIASRKLPSRTVTGSSSQDWIRLKDGSLRRLTFAEVARLQGFPPGWRFAGNKAARFKQVGNAVPAILGEVVGLAIRGYLAGYRAGTQTSSMPLPNRVVTAMEYTKKEERRNGQSRKARVSATAH